MAIDTSPKGLKDLSYSIKTNFMRSYQSAEGYQPFGPRIAAMGSTSSRVTRFPMPIDTATIRKHVGPRVLNAVKATSQDLKVDAYELSYAIDRDDLEDEDQSENSVKIALATIRGAARKYRYHPDRLIIRVLADNAVSVIDGEPLFGTHYVDPGNSASTSYSNTHSSRPLTAANLFAAAAEMMKFVSPDGDPLVLMPRLLLVPPSLEKTALEITKSVYLPNSAGTASQDNVLREMNFQVVVVPQLEALSATTWYLLDVSDPEDRGIIFIERKPVEIVEKFNPDDPAVIDLNEFQWFSRWRGAAGGGNPMKISRNLAA